MLNDAQKQVVEFDEGPILVISGAGTGKTRVLTGRILHLLQAKGIAADRIVALTFTEKATKEMRERVDNELPLSSESVGIYTFHGFCEKVLRERGHEIGINPEFRVLAEADVWLLLKQNFHLLPLKYYRPLGNPERFLGILIGFFSRLQDEDITPDAFHKYWEERAKNSDKSDEGEQEEIMKNLELGAAYKTYQNLLLKLGVLDFAGLIYHTLRLLEDRPSIRREYQTSIQYLMIDEFQDTNFSQNKLVTILAQTHSNLMVVGDDDQSIYKWRGASLTNMKYFSKLFPQAKKVVLKDNYRSTQQILDLAYKVIQNNNPNRLEAQEGISKKLTAHIPDDSTPLLYHFITLEEEVAFVTKSAIAAQKNGKNVAILVRTNSLSKPFISALEDKKVTLQYFSADDITSLEVVKDCRAMLTVLANPSEDLSIFRVLQLPFWNLSMDRIIAMVYKAKHEGKTLIDLLGESEDTLPIYTIFKNALEKARDIPVSGVLSYLLDTSGAIAYAQEGKNPESIQWIEELAQFSQLVANFEQSHSDKSIFAFLDYLHILDATGSSENTDDSIDSAAIKILTIHGSKGLEFDTVFLPGLAAGKFPTYGRKDSFTIPTELLAEEIPEGDHHLEEERRLFYVACTRAKTSLVLSYSDLYSAKKLWKPSRFVEESISAGAVRIVEQKKKRTSNGQQQLSFDEPNGVALGSKENKLPHSLSFSQINSFERCPQNYQYRYIYGLSGPTSPSLSFGTSIHNILKSFYEVIKAEPTSDRKTLDAVMQLAIKKSWVSFGYSTRELMLEQKRRAGELLQEYLEYEIARGFPIPAFIEQPFKISVDDISLSGRIDRIDRLPNGTYEVIDYKTGSVDEKAAQKSTQLTLYALAARDSLGITVSKLTLMYLDGLKAVSTTRSNEDIEKFTTEIGEMVRSMKKSDFTATPGYICSLCEFRSICPAASPVVR